MSAPPRYHPRYREDDDPERLPGPRTARKGGRRGCRKLLFRRPPMLFVFVWAGLVFLLTVNFFTFSRERAPTRASWLAWQAFADIGHIATATPMSAATNDSIAQGQAWDDQGVSDGAAGPMFPLDKFAPLLPNPAPLTEISIENCSPFRLRSCTPSTTPEEDARLGKWVLVDRPLDADVAAASGRNKGGFPIKRGIFDKIFGALDTRYIYYRRSRRIDVPIIVDIKLVESGDAPPEGGSNKGWHRVKHSMRTQFAKLLGGKPSLHLYYQTRAPKGSAAVSGPDQTWDRSSEAERQLGALINEPITELEIMYGKGNEPWPGFYIVGEVEPSVPELGYSGVYLTGRRKPMQNPSIDAHPRFHTDGTFKIMQLADMHFSIEEEPCRDVDSSSCRSVADTLAYIGKWLDDEKPDLVVLTGDQLNGQGTSWDEKSVTPKVLKPIIDREIQWAAILGNHDSQSGRLTRPGVTLLLSRLPYSLTRVGPANLHDGEGAGNYYLRLVSPTPDATNVFNLYFFDSGADAPKKKFWDKWHGYDYLRKDQIDWFLEQSGKVKKILRPYRPDGGVDLPKQSWSARLQQDDEVMRDGTTWDAGSAQGTALAKPNAIAFMHIPVPEFFDNATSTHHFGPDRGEKATKEGAQAQGGFFDAVLEQGDRAGSSERDVRLIVSGHMHNNADCEEIVGQSKLSGKESKVWTCFGGGVSLAAYGKPGFQRRSRVIQLLNFGETVKTWSRLEDGSKVFEGTLWDDLAAAAKTG